MSKKDDKRVLMVAGRIDDAIVGGVFSWIMESMEDSKTKPVSLYINSTGGCSSDALALYDYIKHCELEINTYAMGICHSAALILFLAGNRRYTYKHASFMWHAGMGKISEYTSAEDIAAYSDWIARLELNCNVVIKERASIPQKVLKLAEIRDVFFDAKQALKWGICDEILGEE